MERVVRTLSLLLPGLALSVVLAGCPYNSEVPLDTPSVALNPVLLGSWREDSSDPGPVYTVRPDGEFQYRVTGVSDSGTMVYLAHLTKVAGQDYLNLRLDEDGAKYSLFRLEIGNEGSSFTLHPLTENITERFSRSEDLFAFVERNQGLSFFFESPTRFVRPVSP